MPETRIARQWLGPLGLGTAARTAALAVMFATALPTTAQIQPMPGDPPSRGVAAPLAADPALEARVMDIANELRCLVCQNETIAASHADLAVDLRKQIRVKLAEGQSERQILDFMVARYGEFVLYRPPLKASTVLLWAGPFALLLVAGFVLAVNIRRRRRAAALPELSPAEAQRARALLDQVHPKSP
jgi:cytochrome c-type biogenesis protein CcmH